MCFIVRDFDCVPEEGKLEACQPGAKVGGLRLGHFGRRRRDVVPMQRHDNGLGHRRTGTNWDVRHLRRIRHQSAQSITPNKRSGCGRQPHGESCRPVSGASKFSQLYLCAIHWQSRSRDRSMSGFRPSGPKLERPLWSAQRQQADVRAWGLPTAAVDPSPTLGRALSNDKSGRKETVRFIVPNSDKVTFALEIVDGR
jgi:hypothetical protein